eukprot:jgi/Bigna1/138561/aug1.45_g13269
MSKRLPHTLRGKRETKRLASAAVRPNDAKLDDGNRSSVEGNIQELSMLEDIRVSIRYLLNSSESNLGAAIDIFLLFVNLLACVLFVVDLESGKRQKEVDFVVGSIFLIEYLLRVWVAESRLRYVASWYGIIDLVSCIPVFFIYSGKEFDELRGLQIFRVLRVLRFQRFLETEDFFFGKISRLQLQKARLFSTVLTLIFCFAGSFTAIEGPQSSVETVSGFGESIYFTIITFSTVGYGDITPETAMGRALVSIFIIFTMVFVPAQVHEMVRLNAELARQKAGVLRVECRYCGLLNHDEDATHCKVEQLPNSEENGVASRTRSAYEQCGNIVFQRTAGTVPKRSAGRPSNRRLPRSKSAGRG